jgi:hypothetical protein
MDRQVAVERAAHFIANNPNASAAEHARLRLVLYGGQIAKDAVDRVFAGQRADGGFAPFWAPDYSSLDASCYRLAQLEALGALSDARSSRVIGFFRARQRVDGSFEEEQAIADVAPSWAAPGDPATALYLTANCGFWLGLHDPLTDAANAAGRFLHNQLQKGDALASFMQANWLAAGLWHTLGWMKPFDYACAYLSRQCAALDAADLAWLSTAFVASGVSRQHPLLIQARERLIRLQEDDGRWRSAASPERDVYTTLEAVRAVTADDRRPLSV